MRSNIVFIVSTVCLLMASCAKNHICPDCSAPTQTLKLNIIDNKSTSNLIEKSSFDKSSNNLTIYSTRLKKDIDYRLEITDNGTTYVVFEISGTDELGIKLNNFSADTLKAETKYIDKDCCGSLELVKLSVNNSLISIPSDNVITIRK